MGERVDGAAAMTAEGRAAERARLERELARLHDLVADDRLADGPTLVGTEVELHLVDGQGAPALVGAEALAAVARSAPGLDAQTELARFNLELNLPPRPLGPGLLAALEEDLTDGLARVGSACAGLADPVAIGILPTVSRAHVGLDVVSEGDRYRLLDGAIIGPTGGRPLSIDGPSATGGERLAVDLPSIALEAAATSLQVHLDTAPAEVARTLNAAQAIAAAQVAVSANSPFLLGARLWHETRIPLFTQVIDPRTPAEVAAGAHPRVWFGQRWYERATDPFDENVAHFPPILPQRAPEDAMTEATPELAALRLHNGTVWRWNRPVHAVVDGRARMRVENRVMPAGPTAIDMAANVAVLVGAVRALVGGLADDLVGGPLEERLAFRDAATSFEAAARDGLDAIVIWPGRRRPDAATVVLEVMLPAADRGLADAGLGAAERSRLLDVVAARAASRRTGSAWQLAALRRLELSHDRDRALAVLTRRYLELQRAGDPVHTWPLP